MEREWVVVETSYQHGELMDTFNRYARTEAEAQDIVKDCEDWDAVYANQNGWEYRYEVKKNG